MIYYDIHTHHLPEHPEDIAVLSHIIGVDSNVFQSETQQIFYSVGIHPWYIKEEKDQVSVCKRMLSSSKVIAIGEVGLDKFANKSLQEQLFVFKQQALLAEENRLFVIVHCVKAWNELIALKRELHAKMPWVIHGFRGNAQLAQQLIREGFFLSFGERYNTEAIRVAWPNHLFVETDDSTVDIRSVYDTISAVLDVSVDTFASQVAENVHKILLFPL